jgi:hypothetical protein
MSKHQKLFDLIKNNLLHVRFEEACQTALGLGYEKKGEKVPMSFLVEVTHRIF